MKLKLLIPLCAVVLATGGCVLHFPLSDNQPSLASQDGNGSTDESGGAPETPAVPRTSDHVLSTAPAAPDTATKPDEPR